MLGWIWKEDFITFKGNLEMDLETVAKILSRDYYPHTHTQKKQY